MHVVNTKIKKIFFFCYSGSVFLNAIESPNINAKCLNRPLCVKGALRLRGGGL